MGNALAHGPGPAQSAPSAFPAEAGHKLRAAGAAVIAGKLHVAGRPATAGTLNWLGLRNVSVDRVVAERERLGLRELDRVIDRPLITSWGVVVESGFLYDRTNGRPDRAQVALTPGEYARVPARAPALPAWDPDVFMDRESAAVYTAFLHALAAPRVVSGVGIISVEARLDKTARALVDVASALARGSEAPAPIVLGEFSRDFLSGTSGASDSSEYAHDEDEDEDEGEDEGDEGDDRNAAELTVHGPDEVLGLAVLEDAKELVRAHPHIPIVAINMSPDDFDPSAPVHHLRLRAGVWIDQERVELAAGAHTRLYPELLARVRDAGAPLTFERCSLTYVITYRTRSLNSRRPRWHLEILAAEFFAKLWRLTLSTSRTRRRTPRSNGRRPFSPQKPLRTNVRSIAAYFDRSSKRSKPRSPVRTSGR